MDLSMAPNSTTFGVALDVGSDPNPVGGPVGQQLLQLGYQCALQGLDVSCSLCHVLLQPIV